MSDEISIIPEIEIPIEEVTSSNGRKVAPEYENPIDDAMLNLSEVIAPYFNRMNYTPNGITTISLIFSAAALYHLYQHDLTLFTIYLVLAHLFNNMDEYYAKKYGLASSTNDKYDTIKDLIVIAVGAYILYARYNILSHSVLLIILCVFFVLAVLFVGCRERLTPDENKSESLKFLSTISLSNENCKTHTKYLKYFGPGTFVLIVIFTVWVLDSYLTTQPVIKSQSGDIFGTDVAKVEANPQYNYFQDPYQNLMMYQPQYQPSSSYRF